MRAQRSPKYRGAFTLIELLIVITIIAALAALSLGGTMRVIGVQQERTTKTLVQSIANELDKHWQVVIAKAQHDETTIPEQISGLDPATGNQRVFYSATAGNRFYSDYLLPLAGNDAYRARVIYVKMRLRQEFPISIGEALTFTPGMLPPLPAYVTALRTLGGNSAEQSSICLLTALSQARGGVKTNPEDFGASATNVMGTGGARGFVDSWGKPIMFCRMPTGSAEVDRLNPVKSATSSQSRFCDPQDPTGLLLSPTWFGSPNRARYEALFRTMISPDPTDPPNVRRSHYLVPVVWSAGPDKKFSVDQISLGGGNATDNDNIYSYNLKLGGS